jgi:hypothetical protein
MTILSRHRTGAAGSTLLTPGHTATTPDGGVIESTN